MPNLPKQAAHRFAHITDCHLGAWRNSKLKDLNLKAFEEAVSICVKEKVDFIVITGDFFDVNVPDLAPVKRAVEILREARNVGIQIYLVYGSHDFTPNAVSMIDILHSAGLFIKPTEIEMFDGKIRLGFFQDERTGAKIVGLSGRTNTLDTKYYEMLDLPHLEREEGFKIFLFHTPIAELAPRDVSFGEGVPLSSFPKDFDYYGGGHLHRRVEHVLKDNHGLIIYPGPLFGATFTDLEDTADGEKRGFYIIDFDGDSITRYTFLEIKVGSIVLKTIEADQKTAKQVEGKILTEIEKIDAEDKIVLIKVRGSLSSGRRSDINFAVIEEELSKRGAFLTFINRNALTSEEARRMSKIFGESREEIEKKAFKQRIDTFKIDSSITDKETKSLIESKFVLENGEKTARDLLGRLKAEKLENETNQGFNQRILAEAKTILDFDREAKPDRAS